MEKRAITERDVESALRRRVGPPSPGEPGTLWLRGHAAGSRILKVCVPAHDQDFVITAAWPGVDEEGRG